VNEAVLMRRLLIAAALIAAACRGEKVPRDYQNQPPAMTHPPTSSAQTPTAKGMPAAAPEATSGPQGQTTKPVDPVAPTPKKLKDQAPASTTATRT